MERMQGMPCAFAFAAEAMVYVVVRELIPESHRAGNVDLATRSLVGASHTHLAAADQATPAAEKIC